MSQLTKKFVRERLGLESDAALARMFNVSRAAVAQWGEDDPLPEPRRTWLHLHMADKFPLGQTAEREAR
ncbi:MULTISPECIES: hypothetical protein [unclassified Pseudoxanthomonas]|jgi:DNA-binding transcriptional regulator YiaG|uniref:hypothetical protein n=1 Tax=unclassified Pseudoxanthomonas TaxID=2645906 RepID=UPI00307E49A0